MNEKYAFMSSPLDSQAINAALKGLEGWVYQDSKLFKDIEFRSFKDAIDFINQVGLLAEKQNHHPEIYNCYRRVQLKLSIHDAGDRVTEKDLTLARAIQLLSL